VRVVTDGAAVREVVRLCRELRAARARLAELVDAKDAGVVAAVEEVGSVPQAARDIYAALVADGWTREEIKGVGVSAPSIAAAKRRNRLA
jgi:hypothetical protein